MPLKNSYQSLPSLFFSKETPEIANNSECILYNTNLATELGIEQLLPVENAHNLLSGNLLPEWAKAVAQAYAGHQFGHPTMLGDGRALLLGEWKTPAWKFVDITLKGSGRTFFSRWGDGRATLKAMLREYLMTEALHAAWVPSSRSLAVVKTGNEVYRNLVEDGAVLTRIMSSHIRVGTFEFAKNFGNKTDMQALIDYTIERHYPELASHTNPTLWLLESVIDAQLHLVTQWLRIGFIHGVMNTDNTSIAWETFDYGPCAFIWAFDPEAVFSSIDTTGRYAFGKQSNIILWNLAVFASTLSDFIDEDTINKVLGSMWEHMHSTWLQMMRNKLGIQNPLSTDEPLIRELLSWMQKTKADYSNTFLYIWWNTDIENAKIYTDARFTSWLEIWKQRISRQSWGLEKAQESMRKYNPVYIPRNHIVEDVLDKATTGDYKSFHEFLDILKTPYTLREDTQKYMENNVAFDREYKTLCGT